MRIVALAAASVVFAAGTGFFVARALSAAQQAPTSTVTVNIPTGATGPQGPAGPPGKDGQPGAESCPAGSTFKAVRFIQQGAGPTTIWTCVADQ